MPKKFRNPKHNVVASCLRDVKQKIEVLNGCLKGKQSCRDLFAIHVAEAQKADAKQLAERDKEIFDMKSELAQLQAMEARYSRELEETNKRQSAV